MKTVLTTLLRMGFISTLVFAILACSPKPSFKNVDITGSTAFGKDFSLIDTDGNTKTLADYKGKA
ncbi:MAG: SCO family protein, partial [Polynucleobacter sp.]|nr:SCO family protein [Polynucleobacter sp.]